MTIQHRAAPTLADAMVAIEQDADLSESKKRRLKSDLRTFCLWLDRAPSDVACMPQWLRGLTSGLHHKHLGISKRRLSNVRSSVRRALTYVGQGTPVRGGYAELPAEWSNALTLITKRDIRNKLKAFARFCAESGITPDRVDAAVLERWAVDRENDPRVYAKNPRRLVRQVRNYWNQATSSVDGWPGVAFASTVSSRHVCIPFDQWPAQLRHDWEAYAEAASSRVSGPDDIKEMERIWLADEALPAKPQRSAEMPLDDSTLAGQREAVGQALTAMTVMMQRPLDEHVSLAKITRSFPARQLIAWHAKRGIAPSERQITYVKRLRSIHRRVACMTPQEEEEYREILARFKVETGVRTKKMTHATRRRLAQFRDTRILQEFVDWGYQVFDELEALRKSRGVITHEMACRAEDAIAHIILCSLPLRKANLTSIEIEQHLVMPMRRHGPAVLMFQAHEVKNGRAVATELNPRKTALLRLFLRLYRPRLVAGRANPYLFAARQGDGQSQRVAQRLPARIRRELGLEVNLHFYRHLMATVLLQAYPGEYRQVQSLLAHTPGSDATEVYAELETEFACRQLDRLLAASEVL